MMLYSECWLCLLLLGLLSRRSRSAQIEAMVFISFEGYLTNLLFCFLSRPLPHLYLIVLPIGLRFTV